MKIDYPELEGKEVLYNNKEIIITAFTFNIKE